MRQPRERSQRDHIVKLDETRQVRRRERARTGELAYTVSQARERVGARL